MTKKTLTAFTALAVAVVLISPVVESAQDAIVFDVAVTRTCWDRHGFNFVSRWSCRSSLHQIGPIAVGFACAFRKDKGDLCKTFETVAKENREEQAAK